MSSPGAPAGSGRGEGSLEAPTRHPLDWHSDSFYDAAALDRELERVFDICHGCRRCFSLCNAFPTLFDAVDATDAGEVTALDRKVFWDVVDHCYLCDMCFMTKCPYVPPHPFNVDFPHLMLRAKAVRVRDAGLKLSERVLAATSPSAVASTASNRVGKALHRLKQRRQPWQMSNTRSSSFSSAPLS